MKRRPGMKEKILLLHHLGMKPSEIAKASKTDPSYVYRTIKAAKRKMAA